MPTAPLLPLNKYQVISPYNGTSCADEINRTGCVPYQYNVGDIVNSYGSTYSNEIGGIVYLVPFSGDPIPINNVKLIGTATYPSNNIGVLGGTSTILNPTTNTLRSSIIIIIVLLALFVLLKVTKII